MALLKVNPHRETDQGPIDAIVVIFGAGIRRDGRPSATLRYRVRAALRFAAGTRNTIFIPTGAKGRYGEAEAVVMGRLLIEAGIAEQAIVSETTATDTLSSARAVCRILRTLPQAPVYACTSAYHLPRCLLLFRLAGVPARRRPPWDVPAATGPNRWYWRLREVPALPYDAALMLWHRAARSV